MPSRRVPGARTVCCCLAPFALAVALEAQTASTAPSAGLGEHGLSEGERLYGLALLWKEVDYNFPFFDQVAELDWDETFRQFVGPVLEAGTTLEYYQVLQRFIALLEDGHTNVYLPDSVTSRRAFDMPWIRLEAVGRRAVVENVSRDLIDRLPPGSEILSVDGVSTERYLAERVLPYIAASTEAIRWRRAIRGNLSWGTGLLVGPPDATIRLGFRDPMGEERELEVVRDLQARPGEWARPLQGRRPTYEFRWLEDGIAYTALNTFSDGSLVEQFEASLTELMRARGVVLDLRANSGGSDFIATTILSHFTEEPLVGSGSRIRVNDAMYRAYGSFGEAALRAALPADSTDLVGRSVAHHAGTAWRIEPPDTQLPEPGEKIEVPVVVLIGPSVASAAENFLVYLPDDTRFTTVGQPTVGSTGQPLQLQLPGGGRARVVSRAAIRADGTTWVGTGILPDVPVEPTIDDVVSGRDVVLERGLEVLRERMRAAADAGSTRLTPGRGHGFLPGSARQPPRRGGEREGQREAQRGERQDESLVHTPIR